MDLFIERAPLVITLLLLMAVGFDLRLRDFDAVRTQPRLVAAGVLLPPLMLPALALALIPLFQLSSVAGGGLLLISVTPIGSVANTYVMLARSSSALAVTLTAVSCVSAFVIIPLDALLLEQAVGRTVGYAVPVGALAAQLLVVLLPPIVTGMVVRARWPALADRHGGRVQACAFAVLGVLLIAIFAGTHGLERVGWASALGALVVFVIGSFVLGAAVAWSIGCARRDGFALAVAFSTRNVSVGLAVAVALGSGPEFIVVGALYLLVAIPLNVAAALVRRSLSSGGWLDVPRSRPA
jgi:BASS family bile acid:Na+ symporter